MDRLLATLERRIGRYAPANITYWLVGLSGLVYLLLMARPDLAEAFTLTREGLSRGEVWRLATFLFMPWSSASGTFGPLLTLFALFFLYTIGTSLEAEWGTFRFDLFYALAALGTVASSLVFGSVTNFFINESLFLAFATVFPEYEILLFLVLPVRVKWLGLLAGAALAWQFLGGTMPERAAIVVALGAWLLFCGPTFLAHLRGRAGGVQKARRASRWQEIAAPVARPPRVCALCGKSEKDDPKLDFRVCTCARCGGKATTYCLEHARSHQAA